MKWLHPIWLLFIFCLYDEGNTTVDELMMRLMGAMEIFTAQQQEDIKDEVRQHQAPTRQICTTYYIAFHGYFYG